MVSASPLAVFFTAVMFTSRSPSSPSSSSSWPRNGNSNNKVMFSGPVFASAYSPRQYSSLSSSSSSSVSSNLMNAKKRRAMSCRAHAFLKEGGSPNDFYDIHKIAGDGRCLFRSLVVSKSLEDENTRLSAEREVLEADTLREQTIRELIKRREELEWIIEGDFDEYCANMRYPGAWGGEPEILVASHVLRRPIEVHMKVVGEPLRSIGIYGNEDYGTATAKPKLMLLFHGQGHYEALSKCVNE
jgi:hypothetical protein